MLRGVDWYPVINFKKKTILVEKYDLNIDISTSNTIHSYCNSVKIILL